MIISCLVGQAIKEETVNFSEPVANGTEILIRFNIDHLTTIHMEEIEDKMFVH